MESCRALSSRVKYSVWRALCSCREMGWDDWDDVDCWPEEGAVEAAAGTLVICLELREIGYGVDTLGFERGRHVFEIIIKYFRFLVYDSRVDRRSAQK